MCTDSIRRQPSNTIREVTFRRHPFPGQCLRNFHEDCCLLAGSLTSSKLIYQGLVAFRRRSLSTLSLPILKEKRFVSLLCVCPNPIVPVNFIPRLFWLSSFLRCSIPKIFLSDAMRCSVIFIKHSFHESKSIILYMYLFMCVYMGVWERMLWKFRGNLDGSALSLGIRVTIVGSRYLYQQSHFTLSRNYFYSKYFLSLKKINELSKEIL